jgi:hypothetical protein
MVRYGMLTGAETISLKQLISGTHLTRIHPGHAEKFRMLGLTATTRGGSVVTERGRREAGAFTRGHMSHPQ